MRKKTRLFVLSLTLAALLCALPVSAAGNGWLVPRANEYPGFADVTDTWCEDYVRTAYEAGLMEGNSHTAFDAGSNLTLAQITVMTARLHSLLRGGDGILPAPKASETWYQPAVNYLKSHRNDMSEGGALFDTRLYQLEILPAYGNQAATRYDFVTFLAEVLPESTLPAINAVSCLPDVAAGESQIYEFYNAGVLTGRDQYGFFDAGGTLNRGQAAAILARIIDPSLRVRFTPKPFDLCRDVLLVDPEATALTVDGTAITMEQAAQELCLSLRQEDCDAISGEIPKDDLTESLQIALKELVTDVALDRMAAQQNLTWTRQELEAQYGPLPVGAQGIQEEGWLWEYSHNWLSQQLLLRYLVQYGSAMDPASGDMAAEVRFQQDLDAVKASLSVTPSPALQNLDAAGAQSRLLQYFPCD